MPSAFRTTETNDLMDPYSLAQLADDTAFYSEHLHKLRKKFRAIYISHIKSIKYPTLQKLNTATSLIIQRMNHSTLMKMYQLKASHMKNVTSILECCSFQPKMLTKPNAKYNEKDR